MLCCTCTQVHFLLSTCSRLVGSSCCTLARLTCSLASLGRPFNANSIAWHRRVESRSPAPAPPLSPLCNAMPRSTRLRAIEDCILHCTDAATPLFAPQCMAGVAAQCNALDPLYWPAAAVLCHANKIPRSGGRARPVQGCAGDTGSV